ncbi:MAG: hypothetical protein GWN13_28265, partial [Phycisphaerae bacterium]|nr:hypothetical protein [Phycisphaerae bacterium]NIX02064.1 hypothetical protein [Phycisphaerae bacterium]
DDDTVGMDDNSRCVVYVDGPADCSIVLDGLTVTSGFVTTASWDSSARGAGLIIDDDPNITIVNCTFTGNYALSYGLSPASGAAIYA